MLRFKIKEMIAKKEFEEGRRITIAEVAEGAGIHRVTLSKLINKRGQSTNSDHLDALCRYLDCRIEDLVEYVPDEEVGWDKNRLLQGWQLTSTELRKNENFSQEMNGFEIGVTDSGNA